jgi:hypothetical protein
MPSMRTALVLIALGVSASVVGAPASASIGHEASPAARICASYLTHGSAWDVVSQNFEPIFDAYDAVAADDLQVTSKCRARVLSIEGWYGDSVGPPDSETVTFYRDAGGLPGRVIRSETVVGEDAQGAFEIILDRALRLRPGRTYWVSIQINMGFEGGIWRWFMRSVVDGSPPVWKNPGDGFATGCTDWAPIVDCLTDRPVGDLTFEIRTR